MKAGAFGGGGQQQMGEWGGIIDSGLGALTNYFNSQGGGGQQGYRGQEMPYAAVRNDQGVMPRGGFSYESALESDQSERTESGSCTSSGSDKRR